MPSTSPSRLEAVERGRKALELRKAGATFDAIAEIAGYSCRQSAHRAVTNLLRTVQVETATELRTVQYERLQYMIMKLWPRVQDGDEKAIVSVANLMRQQDVLMGVSAPQADAVIEHRVTHDGAVLVIDAGDTDYIDKLERMAAGAGAAPINKPEDIIEAEVIDDEQLAIEAPTPEPMCPRYVQAADPARRATETCARCPYPKDAHTSIRDRDHT